MSPLDFDRGVYIRYLVFKEPAQTLLPPSPPFFIFGIGTAGYH